MKQRLITLVLTLIATVAANGQIYQFGGENRDGKFVKETGLLKQWPEGGPKVLLEYTGIGNGYSSVISNGKYIYATGMKDTSDVLTCIDFNGNKKWEAVYGRGWDRSYPGNRGSVTIEGDRLYVHSGMGELSCFNTETGNRIWYVNVHNDYQGIFHTWGCAESPLLVGNLVISTPGGNTTSMVAFDKMTGKEVWKTKSVGGERSYITPIMYEYNGAHLIIGATATTLIAVDPANGNIKMSYFYAGRATGNAALNTVPATNPGGNVRGLIWINTPTIKDNMVFLSMGYNSTAVMLKVNASNTAFEEVYTNNLLDNHHGGVIEHNGYMFGSTWNNNNDGNWVCLEWNTGKTMYDTKWTSKGSVVFADGLLYVYDEKSGEMGIMKPDPAGFNIISSFKITNGNDFHWAHPYFLDGKMFHRHGNVLTVYALK